MGALIAALALGLLQLALFVHVRNGLTDVAVQSAYTAALQGNTVADGHQRAQELARSRFSGLMDIEVNTHTSNTGLIVVEISADLPLVGLIGPSRGLVVEGHAMDEDALP